MEWTQTKPGKPGWYWWQPVLNYAEVVLVRRGFVYQTGVEKGKQLGLCAGQWYGPIAAPGLRAYEE